jgi:hypothetical protein
MGSVGRYYAKEGGEWIQAGGIGFPKCGTKMSVTL